jgi:hypothetical protein|tara:strand:- start:428 stop:1033 length:606 start_codon:yes stop_codon:yes gene_type:complete
MTLTASGQITLGEIHAELDDENPVNGSLAGASNGTVATINTANASANRPDGSAPHSMSEFYSYNHDATSSSWGGSWNAGQWNLDADPNTTAYLNRSITFSGMTTDAIDVYYTLNSGTVRGGLSVAVSTSAFPDNNATYTTANSGTGSFGITFNVNGSGTLYCRFKYVQHSSLNEVSNRNIYVKADGETSAHFVLALTSGGL